MAIRYSDAYIETIARAHLQPGEQIIGRAAGIHRPWYTLGVMLFWKNYLVIATNQRLLLAEHRRGLLYDRLEAVHSVPWNQVANAKVSGLLKKKLNLAFGQKKIKLNLPGFLGPMPKNVLGAKAVASTWQQAKALGAGQQHASLPPGAPQHYAAPQMQAQAQYYPQA
jgi:hypothetical protein